MGDLSYWDAEGQRISPQGATQPATPKARTRPARVVVRQLLAALQG